MGVPLDDRDCSFLIATIARDLGAEHLFPGVAFDSLPQYFSVEPVSGSFPTVLDVTPSLAKLFAEVDDADTFFSCLAKLHKSRLKYEQILRRQPFPTFDQVGPRGLLQYGTLTPKGLMALLFWRKWLYDLDNRAAQDTGYLFEPILASAIGGAPVPAKRSPVKRRSNANKGRQVDCLLDRRAYEFKLRVTIAASGQGRWGEELDFPDDCRASGHTPVLVVLDPTRNPKLDELVERFVAAGGEAFVGDAAWAHLEDQAGATMSAFLETYVRVPLASLLAEADADMGGLTIAFSTGGVDILVGDETMSVPRGDEAECVDETQLPDDIDTDMPGV